MLIAIETAGSGNQQATDAIEDIGRRIFIITEKPLETIHLFQRISVAICTAVVGWVSSKVIIRIIISSVSSLVGAATSAI